MRIKKLKWEKQEFAGEGRWRAILPFGFFCYIRKDEPSYRYVFKQRALTLEKGKYGTLKKCKEKCQEIWEGIVMEAWEENKGCEYCLKDTKSLIDEAGEDKGLKSFLETRIEGNSLCTYADIRSEYQEGEKKINYCPMCGRRLEEE